MNLILQNSKSGRKVSCVGSQKLTGQAAILTIQ